MKNKFKLMTIIVLSMVILTGCGVKSPTKVVESYFSEIKKGENAEVANYMLNSVEETVEKDGDKETDPKMEEAMKIYMLSLDAKVLSEEIKDNKASVEIELKGINFSNIIMELLQEGLANAFSGNEMSAEDMNNSILEKIKTAKVETRTGKINLSKVDKEWKIETEDEDFISLIFGRAQELNNNLK